MTHYLARPLANALPKPTAWAPAGQLARLLMWILANEKPQETCVHLNSQMGGQGGTEEGTAERESECVWKWLWGTWLEFPNRAETSSLKRLAGLQVENKSLHLRRDQWENSAGTSDGKTNSRLDIGNSRVYLLWKRKVRLQQPHQDPKISNRWLEVLHQRHFQTSLKWQWWKILPQTCFLSAPKARRFLYDSLHADLGWAVWSSSLTNKDGQSERCIFSSFSHL